ncbi:molybdopterin oxidoreductase family protein [Oscillochloris sp. ZM17-4]|uniref:molybdopterin-containing oxidoreductase family protein n=1 Tax=Oscillochloris sp. ZM17-4 TaxID=2866714 RepID=UPI001C736520|nr:molybdopterin oxidoreductase family protein [Oscillochloris sp. ZM17-4]MBX0331348.1 molybdopterin oxidoreductase family protein [Oscillochloris sp. ZM17-4]
MTTTELIRGACPHDCPDTCATITEVRDGRAVAFYADKAHPYTQGWLCAKVRPYLERVYSPDRLLHPLRRVGPKGAGQWERISWDEALATIADRWRGIIAEHGAAAIQPYSYSGTLGLIQMGVCDARLWNRMGAGGLDRTICCSAAHVAVAATIGARHGPDPADVLRSRLVIIWGNNPASSGPHFMPLLRQAQKAGAYVVVIDPRRTTTARSADEHIQPRPATDAALALGIMQVIFAEGLHDEPWLEAHSQGWRELRERAAQYPPERVAQITGVPAETIVGLARRYATTKPALLKFADGMQRHANGGQAVRALCCLPALVGQYGVPGGGLAYSTSGYVRWDAEALGHARECPPTPRAVNMNRIGAALLGEVDGPPIMSLFVYGANPVASAPNAGLIVRGLMRDDLFTVVHEQFMSDTARYADIVLPATTQLEHADLHGAYGHRNLQYNQPAIAPLGECRSNWDTMRSLAAAMGYAEPWLQQSAEEVIQELLAATAPASPYLEGVSFERLREQGTVPLHFSDEDYTPFAGGRFPTPSGRVELRCPAMTAHGVDPLPDHVPAAELEEDDRSALSPQPPALTLISAASHHFVSSSFGNQPSLRAKEGAPFVEINPEDAAARGIAHGDTVRVESARGWCRLRAVVTADVPPGVAVAPKGQWASLSPDGRNVNWTTPDTIADLGGGSSFHSNRVRVSPA